MDHTIGIWPQAAGGVPFNACEFQSKGDIITDLTEDMAAKQKARSTYDNILRLVRDEPDVYEPIKFLRAKEVVDFGFHKKKKDKENYVCFSFIQITLYNINKFL